MLRRPDAAAPAAHLLQRFTRGERWVHRTTALLMGVCLVTAAFLYVGPLAVAVGRRHLVKTVHVYAGIALPLPMLLGWLSAAFREDLRRLNRFSPQDWEWLRSRDRRSGRIPVGKFNAGQKLNGAFTVGSILVMLGSGLMMRFPTLWPLPWRTGATFVHDWLALAVLVVALGHFTYAAKDPLARLGMRTGLVPLEWAQREHGAWAGELRAAARRVPGAVSARTDAPVSSATTVGGEPGSPSDRGTPAAERSAEVPAGVTAEVTAEPAEPGEPGAEGSSQKAGTAPAREIMSTTGPDRSSDPGSAT